MDFFKEIIVKKEWDMTDNFKLMGIIAAVAAVLFAITIQLSMGILVSLVPLEFILVLYVAFKYIKKLNVEYEYSVTNHSMDVDKIFSMSSRKRLTTVNFKNVEYFAPLNEETLKMYNNPSVAKRIEAITGVHPERVYFVIFQYKGQKTCLSFEPTEAMAENFNRYVPRAAKY